MPKWIVFLTQSILRVKCQDFLEMTLHLINCYAHKFQTRVRGTSYVAIGVSEDEVHLTQTSNRFWSHKWDTNPWQIHVHIPILLWKVRTRFRPLMNTTHFKVKKEIFTLLKYRMLNIFLLIYTAPHCGEGVPFPIPTV